MKGQDRDEWIAKRAYALWEQCGRVGGRDLEHWAQAVRERDELERTQASTDGHEVLIRFRPKAPTATPRRPTGRPAAVAGG
jgi:hypothetical protein